LKSISKLTLSPTKKIPTRSNSRTLAEFIIVVMNGMIAGRVLRIKRMRRKNKIMEAMEGEVKAMADLERRTDMPKDKPVNIIEVAQKQTHLTLDKQTQLQNVLLDF